MTKRHLGLTRVVPRTSDAASSSSSAATSLENPNMIQVTLPRSLTDGAVSPISAVTVEKSGGEWFLCILYRNGTAYSSSKTLSRFPARDILINGKPLDHFLEAHVTKD